MTRKEKKSKASRILRGPKQTKVFDTARFETSQTAENPQTGDRLSKITATVTWLGGGLAIISGAIFLRLYQLGLKPFHHDEGVNGLFLMTLFKNGIYKYDPANYHGPTLYYFALASSYIFGLDDFAVRFVTALFGILIVGLAFSLRRYLGLLGTLTAATLLALSPGLVYISRYFIHEIPFLFFTFAVVVCLVKFFEGEKPHWFAVAATIVLLVVCWLPLAQQISAAVGSERLQIFFRYVLLALGIASSFVFTRLLLGWNKGLSIYLLLAAGSAALAFATKETAFISFGTMLIAFGVIWGWLKFGVKKNDFAESSIDEPPIFNRANFIERIGGTRNLLVYIIISLTIFAVVGIIFFSSFLTYKEGIGAAFEAYNIWTQTGTKTHTQNGLSAYLKWGLSVESPIFILGAIGALIAFLKSKHRLAMFVALWAFGLLAAYSIIPYKTPWLAVNFILPMALIGGYGINELANGRQVWQRYAAKILVGLAFITSLYQTVELNFFRYDDDSRPYIYAHTKRDFARMIKEIDELSEQSDAGKNLKITITSPDYFPLPWTLHNYTNTLFFGKMVDTAADSEIIIGSFAQSAELERKYAASHQLVGEYTLRPGVNLMLYKRNDL